MHVLFLLAWLALIIAVPTPSSAKSCRRYCKPAIARCFAQTGLTRNKCRKALVAACKSGGLAVCDQAFLTPPTTTSTTVPTTTPTTLPPPPLNVAGEWDIYAYLVSNPCGLPANNPLVASGYVSQSGTSLSAVYQSVSGPITFAGQITGADSFQIESETLCLSSCCADLLLTATNVTGPPGAERANVCLSFVGVCSGGLTCQVLWGKC